MFTYFFSLQKEIFNIDGQLTNKVYLFMFNSVCLILFKDLTENTNTIILTHRVNY